MTPVDLVELIKALAYLCIPLATAYTIISANRAKRAEEASLRNSEHIRQLGVDMDRVEKNTNSISERNERIARALGVTEGVSQERASALASAPSNPIPVVDEKSADRIVDAIKEIKSGD